jgi:Asp-tRNA(Asn)/Glu-tRNA(Gln) amidotransferase A subunit family amidase
MQSAITLLRAAGAEVVNLDLPPAFEELVLVRRTIARAEGRVSFLADARLHGEQLHRYIRSMAENQSGITGNKLRAAYDLAAACRAAFDEIAAPFAAIFAPSAAGEAPLGVASTGETNFNEMWTLLHVPCVNLPRFSGPHGMPVGLTLVTSRFNDLKLLDCAEAITACFDAHRSLRTGTS